MAHIHGSPYDSANYRWFAQCYKKFVYIGRIAVSSTLQGKGIGVLFDEDLFAFARIARSNGICTVTCEFLIDPPNLASRKLHLGFGFRQVGTHSYGQLHKQVALQVLALNTQG